MAVGHVSAARVAHADPSGPRSIRKLLDIWWRVETGLIPPVLRKMDPERAHNLTIWALKRGLVPAAPSFTADSLKVSVFGLDFESPVGLAAGFDKGAEAPVALLKQGFAFVEVGTVTPKQQQGNDKPRIFRLEPDQAVINRMGFNSDGFETVRSRLLRNANRRPRRGVIGLNLGANKDSADHASDYVQLLSSVAGLADYFVVNVSSPNTPGLRGLQTKDRFDDLMRRLSEARPKAGSLLVKIAPDLTDVELGEIIDVALKRGVDGLIVSNTTVTRPNELNSLRKSESGGLSGRPLKPLALEILRKAYRHTRGTLPLVGVGGIASGLDAYERIRSGANLIQLYTALVYQGPALVTRIKRELAHLLERDGFATVADAVGVDAR